MQRSRMEHERMGMGRADLEGVNVDGSVRDADVYAIGDDEDEEDEEEEEGDGDLTTSGTLAPTRIESVPTEIGQTAVGSSSTSQNQHPRSDTSLEEPSAPPLATSPRAVPSKYYIESNDTLHSISLRFKLDVRPTTSTSLHTTV